MNKIKHINKNKKVIEVKNFQKIKINFELYALRYGLKNSIRSFLENNNIIQLKKIYNKYRIKNTVGFNKLITKFFINLNLIINFN